MSRTQLHWYAAALSENPEVEQTRRRSGREETQFPMYTVEMATLLEMTELKPFEDMLAMQALTAFSESLGHAMFVSHQWAGHHHPDPKHQQLRILQEAMKNVLSDFQSLLSWLLAVSVVLAQVTSRRSPSSCGTITFAVLRTSLPWPLSTEKARFAASPHTSPDVSTS